jgi:hypothetical protein
MNRRINYQLINSQGVTYGPAMKFISASDCSA